ncbi:hypothetical protein KUTeg_014526 [Tegillarca granosa]|uniref:Uncharacterized protein n=1 Tax=Tegillarca granosa TaxID=220873 RepID=A0ABQ9EU98_TEGGR|nr:hypothetical protein KUTeg_014526 [Tegillarca granosa]
MKNYLQTNADNVMTSIGFLEYLSMDIKVKKEEFRALQKQNIQIGIRNQKRDCLLFQNKKEI